MTYAPLLWLGFRFEAGDRAAQAVMTEAHSLMDILYMLASL